MIEPSGGYDESQTQKRKKYQNRRKKTTIHVPETVLSMQDLGKYTKSVQTLVNEVCTVKLIVQNTQVFLIV